MPQLDVNTFLNQYINILTVLLVVYVVLSYVVLPNLLNILLIRTRLVSIKNKFDENSSSFTYKNLTIAGSHMVLSLFFILDNYLNVVSLFFNKILGSNGLDSSNKSNNTNLSLFYLLEDENKQLSTYNNYLIVLSALESDL